MWCRSACPPTEEREHDFLWRVHRHAPRLGEFAIFNRSHYEDVLVVRVHGLVPKKRVEGALRPHRRLRGAARRARHHRAQVLPAHHARRSRRSACSSARSRRRPRGSSTRTTGRSATTGTTTPRPTRTRSRRPPRRTRRGSWCRRTPSGTATWWSPKPIVEALRQQPQGLEEEARRDGRASGRAGLAAYPRRAEEAPARSAAP